MENENRPAEAFPIRDKADILSPEQAIDVLTRRTQLTEEQFQYIQDVAVETLLQAGLTPEQIQSLNDFGIV